MIRQSSKIAFIEKNKPNTRGEASYTFNSYKIPDGLSFLHITIFRLPHSALYLKYTCLSTVMMKNSMEKHRMYPE